MSSQEPGGSWKSDYGGPLFLLPVYVAGLHVIGEPLDASLREGFTRHLELHQNDDGGFGLDTEGPSTVFTSVLNYVALRLMGHPPDAPALAAARRWFLARGGAAASASWGKHILALLGVYPYEGLEPVPPELWLLPTWVPAHPSRLWCHCRMVYLPLSWLYARRARGPESALTAALRDELYEGPYEGVDFGVARTTVAATDAYTDRTSFLRGINGVLRLAERVMPSAWRAQALAEVEAQLEAEDRATHFLCIGPINKVLNMVVAHFRDPAGPERRAHLSRLPEYLFHAEDGTKVNGYNSSELWDTAFAVQATLAAGAPEATRPMLARAVEFIEAQQVRDESADARACFRERNAGGWPFSTREHGWPITDCTAEAIKALIGASEGTGRTLPRAQLEEGVAFILALQNRDGGWATYERTRGPPWLERLNPSDVFANVMVDPSYVECTSACVQALARWREVAGGSLRLTEAIARGQRFILQAQSDEGGWEGSWGVCFTYGTWFGVTGLLASGLPPTHGAIVRACDFLAEHQRSDGSFSEVVDSCRQRRWIEGTSGHAVNTAWALLTWTAADARPHDAARAAAWLRARQRADGQWPPEPMAGVFNRTCGIHYGTYLRIFPLWALAAHERRAAP